jgi:hypothetical protein
MASVNFFAHIDHLPVQAADDKYGPLSASATDPSDSDNPKDYYRVCSSFSGTGKSGTPNPYAHAVMDGELMVLQTEDSLVNPDNSMRVNLVLRPFDGQPVKGIPAVKYFIYRGILKSDFFSGSLIAPKDTNNNAIIAEIHAVDEAKGDTDEADKFIWNFVALDSLGGSEYLDELFLDTDYASIYVSKGDFIGRYDGDVTFNYSFEIALDDPDQKPILWEAQQDDNLVILAPGTDAEKKLSRLPILRYIDPAAWFGMFARKGFGKVNNNKSTGKADDLQGSKLIDNLLSKFATKETIYLDIRDENGLPIDFIDADIYKKIKITGDSTGGANPVESDYRSTHDWPIHVVNTFKTIETVAKWKCYVLRLALPKGGTSRTTPLVHNPFASFRQSWPKYNSTVRFDYPTLDGDWTKVLKFALVASDSGTNPVASSYIRLEYTQAEDKAYLDKQLPKFPTLQHEKGNIDHKFRLGILPAISALKRTVDGAAAKTFAVLDPVGQYDTFYEAGYLGRQGRAIDASGEVCFSVRGAGKMGFASYSKADSDNIKSTSLIKTIKAEGLSKEKSFFEALREWSVYDKARLEAHFHNRKQKGVLGVHAVKLTGSVNTLDIRINEPQVFRGFEDWSPVDPLYSIAYAHSEAITVDTLVNDASVFTDIGWQRKYLAVSVHSIEEKPSPADATVRPWFKTKFTMFGLHYDTVREEFGWMPEELPLDFYSLDGRNFFTSKYATDLKTQSGMTLWDNHIVPDISADPIYSHADHYNQAVPIPGSTPTTKTFPAFLTDVLNEAKNFDERLVLGEIRDYLYERDINFLSYELAFRLPFFTEDPTQDPYQDITVGTVTKKNNPYIDHFYTPAENAPPFNLPLDELKTLLNWQYALTGGAALSTEATYAAIGTKLETSIPKTTIEPFKKSLKKILTHKERLIFDFNIDSTISDAWSSILPKIHPKGWFLYANRLRAACLAPTMDQITREGLTTTTNALNAWDQIRYDSVATARETELVTNQVPAYQARTFNWENPKPYFKNHGKHPHLPLGTVTTTKNAYDLQHLVDAGIISAAEKTALEAVALGDFGHKRISDGTYTINSVSKTLNGGYIFKDRADAAFYIYDFGIDVDKNFSGVTAGLGYDVGQHPDYTKFLTYIDVASFTGLKETIVRASMGKMRYEAMKVFYPFKTEVWDTITLDYNTTVIKSVRFIQDEFLGEMYWNNFSQRELWKTAWMVNNTFYFRAGGIRTNNEMELAFMSTHAYNKGPSSAWLHPIGVSTNKAILFKPRSKRMIHAFNTHDIRFLRRAALYSQIYHWVSVLKSMDNPSVIKHYRT